MLVVGCWLLDVARCVLFDVSCVMFAGCWLLGVAWCLWFVVTCVLLVAR